MMSEVDLQGLNTKLCIYTCIAPNIKTIFSNLKPFEYLNMKYIAIKLSNNSTPHKLMNTISLYYYVLQYAIHVVDIT